MRMASRADPLPVPFPFELVNKISSKRIHYFVAPRQVKCERLVDHCSLLFNKLPVMTDQRGPLAVMIYNVARLFWAEYKCALEYAPCATYCSNSLLTGIGDVYWRFN